MNRHTAGSTGPSIGPALSPPRPASRRRHRYARAYPALRVRPKRQGFLALCNGFGPAGRVSECPKHARIPSVRVIALIESEQAELLAVPVILPRRVPADLGRNADRHPRQRRLISQRESLYRTQQTIDRACSRREHRSGTSVAGILREAVAHVKIGAFPHGEVRRYIGSMHIAF